MSESTAVVRAESCPQPPDVKAYLELAKHLVPTGFLPEHIKTPGQALAIILTGQELGMRPMRALRSLVLVKGKVVEAADSQLARFKAVNGRAAFKVLTAVEAVLWLRHPNGDEHTESFTIADAKLAGLLSNPSWQKYPKAMLRSRVITAGLKSIGWDGSAGAYDPDEMLAFAPAVTIEEPSRPLDVDENGVEMEPEDVRMPMGKAKGQRLGDIAGKQLRDAAEWCESHGKFPELARSIEAVLARRSAVVQSNLAAEREAATYGTVLEGAEAEAAAELRKKLALVPSEDYQDDRDLVEGA